MKKMNRLSVLGLTALMSANLISTAARAETDYKIYANMQVDKNKLEDNKLVAEINFYTNTNSFKKTYFFQRGKGGNDSFGKNYYHQFTSQETKEIYDSLFGSGLEVDSQFKAMMAFSKPIAKNSLKSLVSFNRYDGSIKLFSGPMSGEKVFSFPGFKMPKEVATTPVYIKIPPTVKTIQFKGNFALGDSKVDDKGSTGKTPRQAFEEALQISKLTEADYTARYEVQGYASPDMKTQKAKDADLKLSQARADAVKQLMIAKGFKAENITAVGYGQTDRFSDRNDFAKWIQLLMRGTDLTSKESQAIKEKALAPNRMIVIIQK